jgi:nicotinamide-nucleotide amidase
MKTCLIGIGDEVLQGQIINTNASYLSSRLTQEGFDIDLQLVVSDFDPDNHARIKELSEKMSLIICTGGLGPTIDDMTRNLFCDLSGSNLIFNSSVFEDLKNRFQDHPYLRLQAMTPEKAELIKNSTGQAPGLMIRMNECLIVALPGVPHEMKTMFEQELLPKLKIQFQGLAANYERKVFLFDIYEVQVDPYLKKINSEYPNVSLGIYPAYGTLRISIKGPCEGDVDFISQFLKETFKQHVYESSNGKIEQGFYELLKKHKLTFASAESITGGQISSRLVSIHGASDVFLGSLVAYSNQLKESMLAVNHTIIQKFGAVSEETADCMLQGLLLKTGCDVGCAVTGIAGPTGATESKPLGLVFIAVGQRGKAAHIFKCQFSGDRAIVIEKASTFAFGYLIQYLKKNSQN